MTDEKRTFLCIDLPTNFVRNSLQILRFFKTTECYIGQSDSNELRLAYGLEQ